MRPAPQLNVGELAYTRMACPGDPAHMVVLTRMHLCTCTCTCACLHVPVTGSAERAVCEQLPMSLCWLVGCMDGLFDGCAPTRLRHCSFPALPTTLQARRSRRGCPQGRRPRCPADGGGARPRPALRLPRKRTNPCTCELLPLPIHASQTPGPVPGLHQTARPHPQNEPPLSPVQSRARCTGRRRPLYDRCSLAVVQRSPSRDAWVTGNVNVQRAAAAAGAALLPRPGRSPAIA